MPLQTDADSRFYKTQTVVFDGEEVFGKWDSPSFVGRNLRDGEYTPYQVDNAREGRPDMISNEVYGTTQLDWVLIAANGARGALNWPRAGDVIKVPIVDLVSSELK